MKEELAFNGSMRISFPKLAVCTVLLPLTAFCFCVYYSLKNNFKSSTATHCRVENYLPSISVAIGEFFPQKYIWRMAIALHSAPRFMLARLYWSYMKRILPCHNVFQKLQVINTGLNVIENIALLGLTFVASNENYEFHKFFFILFMVCSECYMTLTCLLLKESAKYFTKPFQRLAFLRKKQLLYLNVSCFVIGLYFFYRHNAYCEPGMYTIFAIMEYVVALSNMAFHMTAYYDFYDYEMVVLETTLPS